MRPYHKATLSLIKGKYYVFVTIPRELRPAFNGQTQLKRSTGTSDRSLAERLKHDKAEKIYAEFDERAATFDPLANAANAVLNEISPENSWLPDAWDDETLDESANELRSWAGAVTHAPMHPGMDPEDGLTLGNTKARLQPLIENFEDQYAARKAGATGLAKVRFSMAAQSAAEGKAHARSKTASMYAAATHKFTVFAGDPDIRRVTRQDAIAFVDDLSSQVAQNTLQRDIGAVRRVFAHAQDRGWITANPFDGISLKGRGRPTVRRLPFRPSQLEALFALDLPARDRLALSILAATGMRLDEVALLDWGDIREEGGVRYFDLQRLDKILKNDTAARQVPIPTRLEIPKAGSGPMFDYRRDADGKAQNAASKALMSHVRKVRDDETDNRLTVHSLRHTYKDMLREADVPTDTQDFILGHKGPGQGSNYGSGPSLATKAKYMELVDLSFLAPASTSSS